MEKINPSYVKAKYSIRVMKDSGSMANTIMSSKELKGYDCVRGIHGAARKRKGFKKASNSARRRYEKMIIRDAVYYGD